MKINPEYLKEHIENALKDYLIAKASKILSKDLLEAMSYALLGEAKRIRPLLTLTCALGLDKKDPSKILKESMHAFVSIELIHTYSLIHDDLPCMDDDDYRRNKPSTHIKFGESLAILAGDALLTDAFGVASLAKNNAAKLCYELSNAAGSLGIVCGQALDLSLKNNPNASKQDWFLANQAKTAFLFEAACVMGALSIEASESELKLCQTFGLKFGECFQLQDDLADSSGVFLFGSSKKDLMRCKEDLLMMVQQFRNPSHLETLIQRIFPN